MNQPPRGKYHCTQVIKSDGSLGPWGKHLDQEFRKAKYAGLLTTTFPDDQKLGVICPRLRTMPKEERIRTYIWLFSSLISKESSCGTLGTNPKATTETALGLLQLNTTCINRCWRGAECSPPHIGKWVNRKKWKTKGDWNDLVDPYKNINCGVRMFHDYQTQSGPWKDKPSRGIFVNLTYWAPVKVTKRGSFMECGTVPTSFAQLELCHKPPKTAKDED